MERYTKMHTRHLLGQLKRLRADLSRGPNWDGPAWTPEEIATKETALTTLKMVLATREHIPSIQEGKAIRQKAAAESRGQGKGRNR